MKNDHICIMTNKEYNAMMENALRQREQILSSKKFAKKLMKDLGIDKILAKYETMEKTASRTK